MIVLRTSKGRIECERLGSVFCKRYVGEFSVASLQSKADTGLWYSHLSGNPHIVEGEGRTPEDAIADSISRTNSLIATLQTGVAGLTSALGG